MHSISNILLGEFDGALNNDIILYDSMLVDFLLEADRGRCIRGGVQQEAIFP